MSSRKVTSEQCKRWRENAKLRDPEGYRLRNNEARKRYREKYPDKCQEYQRQYRERYPDKRKEQQRAASRRFYQKNRSTLALLARQRYAALSEQDKERVRQAVREWWAKQPRERLRGYEQRKASVEKRYCELMEQQDLPRNAWKTSMCQVCLKRAHFIWSNGFGCEHCTREAVPFEGFEC